MKESNLKIDIRRKNILDILRRDGKVYVSKLCKELNVSAVTIRNDLSVLEQENKLVRMSGGAMPISNIAVSDNIIPNYDKKAIIAATAASQIKDGDTLFINSGTTSLLVATKLSELSNLNIVTNSIDVAKLLGSISSLRVILLGGEINSQYGFTYGSDAQEQLSRFSADWAILSIDGISCDGEITTYHAEEAVLDRIMTERSTKVLIVADSSKIGRTGFSFVGNCIPKINIITNAIDSDSSNPVTVKDSINITFVD